jgi:hypothetical protein
MKKDRANTNEEKKEVLNRIFVVWSCRPSLRLGQLIEIVMDEDKSLFYVEDFELARLCEEWDNEKR